MTSGAVGILCVACCIKLLSQPSSTNLCWTQSEVMLHIYSTFVQEILQQNKLIVTDGNSLRVRKAI